MNKLNLIEEIIVPFLNQVKDKSLETNMFPKAYDNEIKIKVGLGQGKLSNVPYVAFLGRGQIISNGIYPVVTFFRNHNVLFLAYGKSVSGSNDSWGEIEEGSKSIENYFRDHHMILDKNTEEKYGGEKIYSAYELENGELKERDANDLVAKIEDFIVVYKNILKKDKSYGGMNIEAIENVFNHTTTSYKFYWALALLELIGENRTICTFHEVVICMLARAWNTIDEGISLGKQDKLQERIKSIKKNFNINHFSSIKETRDYLMKNIQNDLLRQDLSRLEDKVPYYFLSSWITYTTASEVEYSSRYYENGCPYGIWKEVIKINPDWLGYLKDNCDSLIDKVNSKLNVYLNK